jgi:diacylglycerol kinase (ATP)
MLGAMASEDTHILLNPEAGGAEAFDELARRVGATAGFQLVTSDSLAALGRQARACARAGARAIVAAGGDGTLSAVLNALGTSPEPPALGLLPLGTGNDLARALGIPLEPQQALEELLSGAWQETALDLMRVRLDGETRLAINAVNGGFGARVGDQIDPELKRLLGPFAYLVSGGRTIAELTRHHVVAETDEGTLTSEAWNLLVMNGTSVGGGIVVAPEADPTDGQLDLVIVPVLGELLAQVPAALDPETDHGVLRRHRVTRVRIDADPPMVCNRDGETSGCTPLEVEILPGAIRFLRPGAA